MNTSLFTILYKQEKNWWFNFRFKSYLNLFVIVKDINWAVLLGIRLMARNGLSTLTVRIAERFSFSTSRQYSSALKQYSSSHQAGLGVATMVLLFDGNSEYVAHLWTENCNLIYSVHLYIYTLSTTLDCAMFYSKPPDISSMVAEQRCRLFFIGKIISLL